MIALREKDGMQVGVMSIALAAALYASAEKSSIVRYYCDLAQKKKIKNLHYDRADERLYDESKMGDELKAAKAEGIAKRDRIMAFFGDLAERGHSSKISMNDVISEINSRRADDSVKMPKLNRSYFAAGAVVFETDDLRFILRASGTDAVLRYYIEGQDLGYIKSVQKMLINLEI